MEPPIQTEYLRSGGGDDLDLHGRRGERGDLLREAVGLLEQDARRVDVPRRRRRSPQVAAHFCWGGRQ